MKWPVRITLVITGHERETNHLTLARMSAPCATHCYSAHFAIRGCYASLSRLSATNLIHDFPIVINVFHKQ